MDKILEMLGLNKLDEAQKTEIQKRLELIIESKVKENIVVEKKKLDRSLTEKYKKAFELYKKDVTSKFSDFIDEVLKEEVKIPAELKEFARKGKLYSDIIDQLKVRISLDENLINKEAKELLKDAAGEISKLKKSNDKLMKENLIVKSDARDFAANIHINKITEGLTTKQKAKIRPLLEGLKTQKELDEKFKLIKRTILNEDDDMNTEKKYKCKCNECGYVGESDTECSTTPCTQCGAKMTDASTEDAGEADLDQDNNDLNDSKHSKKSKSKTETNMQLDEGKLHDSYMKTWINKMNG